MSTDVIEQSQGYATLFPGLDSRSRGILRLSLGATAALAVAYAVEWPLSFASGIFVWVILNHPEPGWGWRDCFQVIGALFRGVFCGLLIAIMFAQSPILMLLIIGLVLFLTYYANTGGAHPYSVLFMLVGNTLIPLFATKSIEFAVFFTVYLFLAGAFAAFMALLAYGVFPEPKDGHDAHHDIAAPMSQSERMDSATRSVLIIMPLIVVFYTFGWAGMFLTLAFTAIISMDVSADGSLQTGTAIVKGVTVGGIASVIFYNILLAVPLYLMLILLFCLSALVFSAQYFSDNPLGKYYALGFSTVVIIISTSTMPSADEAEVKLIGRLFRIGLAAIWVIYGTYLLERLFPRRTKPGVAS